MDHSDVVRLQAVEKYVLGELPADTRDEFEEHYFDCSECATDVRALTTFMATSREILAEGVRSKTVETARSVEPAAGRGWLAWFRPVIAVPAMAALALVIVFQNFVTIPDLKRGSEVGSAAQAFESSFHLQGATRGDRASKVAVAPRESFALDFDFTPAVTYQSYTGKLVDGTGTALMSFPVGGEMANKEIHLVVAGGKVQPGKYELVFLGENGSDKNPVPREVQRIPFIVESRP
ncbi:MAG TPA: zf-HC2 domain-containing protein [Dongiaceae bacterium]|nr:zf-HC2 domain-containing protein [Dongiaceae bacterium]